MAATSKSFRRHGIVPTAVLILIILLSVAPESAEARELALPSVNIDLNADEDDPGALGTGIRLLLVLTVLAVAPALLLMVTSFTRIVIVLSFVRNALATQQMPPNQVLIGLALFMTVFVMTPVWQQVYADAWVPLQNGEATMEVAYARATVPVRAFMLTYTRERDLELFLSFADSEPPDSPDDVPLYALVPAFAISELKTAFQMGFLVFLPFIVIDMVVASTLMSMGMLMLPPMMISLPFKVLLFVMVDGWHLVMKSILDGLAG